MPRSIALRQHRGQLLPSLLPGRPSQPESLLALNKTPSKVENSGTPPWLGLGSLQTVNNILSYKTPSALECWPRTRAWRPRLSISEGASSVCGFPLGPGVWAPLPVLSLGEPQPPGMEMRVEMLSFVR